MSLRTPLPSISPYTFGTMSVGSDVSAIQRDTDVVREAMAAGVWFHTATRYACGADYNLLGRTFAQEPDSIPRCICKIRCDNADILRIDVEQAVRLFGIPRVDIAQLCRTARDRKDAVVRDFVQQGPMWEACRELKEQGVLGNLVLEVFYGCSEDGLEAVANDLFDGYAFYFNVLNREISNELYDALCRKECPIVSIRSGGFLDGDWVERTRRDRPAHRDLQMYQELVPLFERSGCADWLEFSMRFLFSIDRVVTTIGGTRTLAHLHRHLAIANAHQTLPRDIVDGVLAIQQEWMAKA